MFLPIGLIRIEIIPYKAGKIEIQDTEDEGIPISFLITPVEYVCTEDKIQGDVCRKVELGDSDSSGSPTLIPIDNSN